MRPLSKILLATDFSEASLAAAPFVWAIASHYSAEVHVVHVAGSGIFPVLPANEKEKILQEAESEMRTFLQPSVALDHDYQHLVCGGDAAVILCGLGQTLNIDLIVLGTNGRRGLRRFVLGSVAEEIFRGAPCPVLTIGPKARGKMSAEIKLRQILFATDLEHASLQALPCAMKLANDYDAQLVLLHVAANKKEARAAHARLAAIVSEQHSEANVELRIEIGPPASRILKAANNIPVDLIIMGVRGGGTWERLATHAPGPVAYNVIAQAPCPVLTIRAYEPGQLSNRDAA